MSNRLKIVKGKWNVGNLYDSVVADRVDKFFNLHRQFKEPSKRLAPHLRYRYKEFNYKFNFKNR